MVKSRFEGQILIVDEEGLLRRNPQFNFAASLASGVRIVGNAVLCKHEEFR